MVVIAGVLFTIVHSFKFHFSNKIVLLKRITTVPLAESIFCKVKERPNDILGPLLQRYRDQSNFCNGSFAGPSMTSPRYV